MGDYYYYLFGVCYFNYYLIGDIFVGSDCFFLIGDLIVYFTFDHYCGDLFYYYFYYILISVGELIWDDYSFYEDNNDLSCNIEKSYYLSDGDIKEVVNY